MVLPATRILNMLQEGMLDNSTMSSLDQESKHEFKQCLNFFIFIFFKSSYGGGLPYIKNTEIGKGEGANVYRLRIEPTMTI